MIKKIKVDKEYNDILKELLLHNSHFPWYYNETTVLTPNNADNTDYGTLYDTEYGILLDKNVKETSQFTHTFCKQNGEKSDNFHYLIELLDIIKENFGPIKNILRIKSNLLLKNESYLKNSYHPPHIDWQNDSNDYKKIISVLYYVNDSDGDTVFFNEYLTSKFDFKNTELTIQKEITPESGSLLVFKSNQFHTSKPPILTDRRVVINFILEMENDIEDTQLS
jgi:hypothetical protein